MNITAAPASDRLPLERRVRVRTAQGEQLAEAQPVSDHRLVHAWVLIGDPGAGKSDVLQERREAEGGTYLSARNFVTLGPGRDWQAPLFIDGLDEISSGSTQGRTALDAIRTKLQELGTPRFRISCREADWRGSADSTALQRLVNTDDFLELHLESLNREEARALVAFWRGTATEQAETFLREAERRGLDGLLDNPQNLRMLVKAVTSGWPASRLQTYAQACAELIKEENPEHRAAHHEAPRPHTELLRASEYLCAVLLLSGKTSWALQRADNTPADSFALNDLPTQLPSTPEWASCREALGTRVFRGASGLFYPVHRTVAEYLGARYLLERLQAGLPIGRLLALMLGDDSGTVPELRGLHAWLAALARGEMRVELITHDPLGAVLYGDVHDFTPAEKGKVLEALGQEARRYTFFRSQDWSSEPFGALATADMEEVFRTVLTSPDRGPAHLALVDCVLDALAYGHAMPGLQSELEQVIRDASYWPSSRIEALRVLLAQERQTNNWPVSLQLLEDIATNRVKDAEDELLGTLLAKLYPEQIPAVTLWRYFREPKSDALIGAYWEFWHHLADKYAPTEDISILLDALIAQGFQLDNRGDRRDSADIIGKLLSRGLTAHGAEIDVPRLYRWLLLGLGPHSYCPLDHEHQSAIRDWLRIHPDRYKALFEYGLQQQLDEQNAGLTFWQLQKRLYQAPEPPDADQWYLGLASKMTPDAQRRHLLAMAFYFTERTSGIDPALELLEALRTTQHGDAPWIDGFLQCPYPPNAPEQEHINFEIKHKRRIEEEKRQKIEFFRKTLPSFQTETAHLGALVAVGNAYLHFFHDTPGDTPQERLQNLLNQDHDWVKQALHGLRQCLWRKDLPSMHDILDLHAKQRRYNLATPCLAAMALRQEEDPATALALPDNLLETVVAFRLTNDYENRPEWFNSLLVTRLDILTRVILPLATTAIAAKKEHVPVLYELAHDPDYAALARVIVPTLIQHFPYKAQKKQLAVLRVLIVAAIHRLDRDVALDLIAAKLSNKSLDVAQHVYWLGAGLQLAPAVFLEETRDYVGKSQLRGTHLADLLLAQSQERGSPRPIWPVTVLELLIQLLGPRTSPRVWRSGARWVSPAMERGSLVESLITTLAGLPDDDAAHILTSLLKDARLTPWVETLRRAAFDQQITRRKAHFQPAGVLRVCNTLANLRPASAADLWALTQHHLHQLIRRIRDENTNDYQQYWANAKPKSEEECRNALLSDLKLRLESLSITAEPEVRYADDKRADIKVSAEGYSIPIEIKCEWNSDLWKGIEVQLIAKYTRDPACDGFGLYLVLWFGGSWQKATPLDSGALPKNPTELQQRLTASIPEQHRHKIGVLVLDCSLPPPKMR